MKKLIFLIVFILSFTKILWAEKEARPHAHEEKEHSASDTHDDHDEENHEEHGKHDKHKPSSGHAHEEHPSATKKAGKGHAEGDEHGEKNAEHKDEHGEGHGEEEANSAVGPDKGILEKGEDGFKLSPEAIKSFELKTQKFENFRAQFPRLTLVEIKEDKFVYRIRGGWIKKVPVKLIKKERDVVTLELSQFKSGDQVIVSGTGFVRVSELVAEEGMAEGHSH